MSEKTPILNDPTDLAGAHQYLAAILRPRYGAGEAAAIARIVMEDVFGAKTSPPSRLFSADEIVRLQSIAMRLQAGEPVQYVLGEADFFGYKFKVSPAVLIPRQETEELVALALDYIRASSTPMPRVLDIGSGSGCIGLTLKKQLPFIEMWGFEKSSGALAVAQENAVRLAIKPPCYWVEGDIFRHEHWLDLPFFDGIISNPPYIAQEEQSLMPEHVLAHEPALALFAPETDALAFYRVIAQLALEKLKPGGFLLFECNEFNAKDVMNILTVDGFEGVFLKKDLAGADRNVGGFKSRTL